jgi:hypothetical protein
MMWLLGDMVGFRSARWTLAEVIRHRAFFPCMVWVYRRGVGAVAAAGLASGGRRADNDGMRIGLKITVLGVLVAGPVASAQAVDTRVGGSGASTSPTPAGVASSGSAVSGKRVDQGITDAGPLNRSLRQVPLDLRVDDAFQGVYEIAATKYGPVQYMRSAGGLHAVFPQSEYENTRTGISPVTPAGVVYWIGEPPKPLAVSKVDREDGNNRIDLRVFDAERVDASVGGDVKPAAPTGAGTMEDQSYRLSVLWRLAQAEKARLGLDEGEEE